MLAGLNMCANVSENAGVLDMTAFAKCRVRGAGARAFLDYFFAVAEKIMHEFSLQGK